MDDPGSTVPVPKPTPPDGGRITDEAMGALFDVASPAFATQRTTPTQSWQPPSVEELQKALPQYEVTQFIARGGMGAVYKGTQKTLKRTVAIKVLPPEIEEGDMQFSSRFKHEAQAMARLTHPNIVAVYDAGEVDIGRADGTPSAASGDGGLRTARPTLLYFVMEFIEGTDVHQLITSEKRLDPQRAMSITTAVCDALAFAHEEGIIHRDIKPSNIMLDKKGRVKVADFGLAKAVNLDSTMLTGSNVAMGTPDFIAPEALIAGTLVDQRADLYAVGVMLYQMLTGRIPRGRFALPSGIIPQIDPRLDAIVDKAMQTEREKRYSTAQEMKADVEKVVQGFSPHTPTTQHTEAAQRPRPGLKPKTTFLIAAAIIAIAAAAFFAFKNSGAPKTDIRSVSPSPSPPVSKPSGLSASTEPWQDALRDPAMLGLNGGAGRTPEGLRFTDNGNAKPRPGKGPQTDYGVRMRTSFGGLRPEVRARQSGTGSYLLFVKDAKTIVLRRWDGALKAPTDLREFPLRESLVRGQDYELELRAVGQTLTAKFNGQILGTVTDVTFPRGDFAAGVSDSKTTGTDTAPVLVKTLEYLDLGGGAVSPSPSPQVSPSPPFPPGKWTKVFTTFEELRAAAPDQRGFAWQDGWIDASAAVSPSGAVARVPGSKGRNGGIRLHGKIAEGVSGSSAVNISVRNGTGSGAYQVNLRSMDANANVGIICYDASTQKSEDLRVVLANSKLKPGDEFDLELIAIGDKLYGKFNGKALPVVTDARLTEGEMLFQTRHLARDIEVINLDGLSEAEALKLAGVEGK